MLQIQGISKTYRTGSLVQQALDRVSINLRDSEFVAILGQSGSGKTTLLNIVGGLDRYDEGDLVINGVSTKRYSDRDWDSYRNHAVGFVFQGYNLIPHQTVLANVELALTISGVSRRERARRAREALEKVGLSEHIRKKPSQLSGGQMQRVAIARALVNDPDILLADEPTGALDSETSVQVMELLKEVARDCLVVMVTHNPDLAAAYATRTVTLKDGRITSDSDPYEPGTAAAPPVHKKPGRASMSFFTALLLSFNNLWTKKTRTILVAVAGSIGIIGIAMILSMSTGANRYIRDVEEDALQEYPLQITDTVFDLSSMLASGAAERSGGDAESETAEVREWSTVTRMLSRVSTNDLASLKAFFESGQSGIDSCARAVEYEYNLVPRIFSVRGGVVRQVNPDRSFQALGFSSGESGSGLLSSFSSTDTFHPMPRDGDLYRAQYEVKAGRWPGRYNECVVVLTASGRVTDIALYTLGLKDPGRLDELVRAFAEGVSTESEVTQETYRYEDFLGIDFRLIGAYDLYAFDRTYGVWSDRSDDEAFLRAVVEKGEIMTVVGVVMPREDSSAPILSYGLAYPAELIDHLTELARESDAVKAQLASPETDVTTGRAFGEEAPREDPDLSSLFHIDEDALADAFQFDPGAMKLDDGAYAGMDLSDLDLSGVLDPDDFTKNLPTLSRKDVTKLLSSVKITVSAESMEELFRTLLSGYLDYAAADPSTDFRKLPDAMRDFLASDAAGQVLRADLEALFAEKGAGLVTEETLSALVDDVMAGYPAYLEENGLAGGDPSAALAGYLGTSAVREKLAAAAESAGRRTAAIVFTEEDVRRILSDLQEAYARYAGENGLPDPALLLPTFEKYMETDEAKAVIGKGVSDALDTSELEKKAASMFSSYSRSLGRQIAKAMEKVGERLSREIGKNVARLMEDVSKNMLDAFALDPEAVARVFTTSFSGEELRDLMASLFSTGESSLEGNLRKLGYADPDKPSSIVIYPTDFDGKTRVKEILSDYNDRMRAAGEEEKVISYTDMVETLMSSVTDIVDAIGYVLIAFVSISLVVSSIMIGVITYISVLERRKEIGILRAIGASKRNISAVFNAETFIIGALAGLFGVIFTLLLLIPANQILRSLTGQEGITAFLPPFSAAILVLLSILLTLIGGIIPSRKAARSDPVAALRSE
ncbi:MAG: ABC transporter ATP-binding protein/permease [Clostridia bacterium]|nr:ABC transporter ATP-binding protein/permease [Clostridia bacterium]